MGKHKQPQNPFPEMEALFEGMQDLLTDEHGNPLPPDHPQYKKVANFLDRINLSMKENTFTPPQKPEGQA